ncbi:replication initiator protein A [Methylorubrum extorquens]|uniref:Replication protein A n=1 Tax=Methylorubrum extorquens (strain ATCC 14718 / DSM 1338 / JCM 2805 / NCIMB 9133 / AM1) TaxID=272630 RepID=C5B6N0_METEA|nr:replication initiator protein A [Methylorubrum extorquens]ACS44112.1 putative replication protein A [Methylorubrum extorquens AM1]MCP1546713.1 plasmid replication initiation protein [Methylorubrum extorquens]MCP1591963.1 plasmid replication initiation protein [Methylorubrum extorquens]
MSQRQYIDRQSDLFVPFVAAGLSLRDQRETMERPFFSLSKNKRLKPIEYRSPDGSVFVNVYPNPEFGMATIWDADILIWAASALTDLKRRGANDLPRTLHFQPYDLLTTICRDTGGREYALLRNALARLQSTSIVTNIRAEKTRRKQRQFGWIESWSDLVDEVTDQSRGMSITLSDWFYEGVVMDGGVLAIDPAYFSLTGGRERWLYRVARKHAGGAGAAGFAITLPTLFEKSGAEGTYRRFKFEIQGIVRCNELPGFQLALEAPDGSDEPMLRMRRTSSAEDGEGTRTTVPEARPRRSAKASRSSPPEQGRFEPMFRFLTDETINAVRRDFPGWDVHALKAEFDIWIDGGENRQPQDYQAAFYGFVKRHDVRNRHQLAR